MSTDGNLETGYITKIQRHKSISNLRINLSDGSCLRVTRWHPIATRQGWTKAAKLTTGLDVQVRNDWASITSIKTEWGLATVYDVTVSPNANFIADGVVVHNKSYAAPIPVSQLPGSWMGPVDNWVSRPNFGLCRMELDSDNTGYFSTLSRTWRITEWTAGKRTNSPSFYKFNALLEPLETPCDKHNKPMELRGEVGPSQISIRYTVCTSRHKAVLKREEALNDQLSHLRDVMNKHRSRAQGE